MPDSKWVRIEEPVHSALVSLKAEWALPNLNTVIRRLMEKAEVST